MIDLRNYNNLIRSCVTNEKEKDTIWKWAVKSISKNKIEIKWGYLEYLEEKNTCFRIKLDNDNGSGCGNWLFAYDHRGDLIEVYMVSEGKPDPNIGAEQTIKSGIQSAIEDIAYFAHSRY